MNKMDVIHGILAMVALLAGYGAAPHLPRWMGWENGPVETAQVLCLFGGGLLAAWYAYREKNPQIRSFWRLLSVIWLVLAVREISWGATFLPPLEVLPNGEPVYSARRQLWYYPLIRPALAAIVLACIFFGVRTRQHKVLQEIWRRSALPLLHTGVVLACMVTAAAAEGKLGLSFSRLTEEAGQVFEELAEGLAYVFMVLGQHRVWRRIQPPQKDAMA